MGIQWVVVAAAVLSCTLYTPEAKPVQFPSSVPDIELGSLTPSQRLELNRIWNNEINKVPRTAGESTQFLKSPGQGRYIYGYTFNNGLQSHVQASDGKERTLGRYTYKDAAGKDVEVHYTSGPGGYKVLTNNLPTDTEEVRLAKEAFFKSFQERKALHEKQRLDKAAGVVAVAAASTLTSSQGRPMAAALKYGEYAVEEDSVEGDDSSSSSSEEGEDSSEEGEDSSEEGEDSSSEESSEEDDEGESDEDDEEEDDEEEGDEDEGDEEEGDEEEGDEEEEGEDEEGEEEDEDEEDDEEEDDEDSSSSSSSSEEDEEDEDTLRAQFEENYGNKLYQAQVVYGGSQ